MKKQVIIFLMLLAGLLTTSTLSSQPNKIPPFQMMQANGKVFKAQYLPLGKPIVLIYFSPDCDECQKLTKEMLERSEELKNVSIAMITYQPVEQVVQYVAKNNLGKYPNIYVGTEGSSLFVRNYYDIMLFPFMTLYNKDGDLIVKYTSKQVNVEDLMLRIRNLTKY
ncbi:MAG: redoxin domain-containing protein [Bacteroidales bacterium]|nr:redoxin domain-containing protein [Bacteroidales bacterium]MBK7627359.1 redoxin domain-containing protein [Bacteroidales bacterium]